MLQNNNNPLRPVASPTATGLGRIAVPQVGGDDIVKALGNAAKPIAKALQKRDDEIAQEKHRELSQWYDTDEGQGLVKQLQAAQSDEEREALIKAAVDHDLLAATDSPYFRHIWNKREATRAGEILGSRLHDLIVVQEVTAPQIDEETQTLTPGRAFDDVFQEALSGFSKNTALTTKVGSAIWEAKTAELRNSYRSQSNGKISQRTRERNATLWVSETITTLQRQTKQSPQDRQSGVKQDLFNTERKDLFRDFNRSGAAEQRQMASLVAREIAEMESVSPGTGEEMLSLLENTRLDNGLLMGDPRYAPGIAFLDSVQDALEAQQDRDTERVRLGTAALNQVFTDIVYRLEAGEITEDEAANEYERAGVDNKVPVSRARALGELRSKVRELRTTELEGRERLEEAEEARSPEELSAKDLAKQINREKQKREAQYLEQGLSPKDSNQALQGFLTTAENSSTDLELNELEIAVNQTRLTSEDAARAQAAIKLQRERVSTGAAQSLREFTFYENDYYEVYGKAPDDIDRTKIEEGDPTGQLALKIKRDAEELNQVKEDALVSVRKGAYGGVPLEDVPDLSEFPKTSKFYKEIQAAYTRHEQRRNSIQQEGSRKILRLLTQQEDGRPDEALSAEYASKYIDLFKEKAAQATTQQELLDINDEIEQEMFPQRNAIVDTVTGYIQISEQAITNLRGEDRRYFPRFQEDGVIPPFRQPKTLGYSATLKEGRLGDLQLLPTAVRTRQELGERIGETASRSGAARIGNQNEWSRAVALGAYSGTLGTLDPNFLEDIDPESQGFSFGPGPSLRKASARTRPDFYVDRTTPMVTDSTYQSPGMVHGLFYEGNISWAEFATGVLRSSSQWITKENSREIMAEPFVTDVIARGVVVDLDDRILQELQLDATQMFSGYRDLDVAVRNPEFESMVKRVITLQAGPEGIKEEELNRKYGRLAERWRTSLKDLERSGAELRSEYATNYESNLLKYTSQFK